MLGNDAWVVLTALRAGHVVSAHQFVDMGVNGCSLQFSGSERDAFACAGRLRAGACRESKWRVVVVAPDGAQFDLLSVSVTDRISHEELRERDTLRGLKRRDEGVARSLLDVMEANRD
jgi:hypothetical protein